MRFSEAAASFVGSRATDRRPTSACDRSSRAPCRLTRTICACWDCSSASCRWQGSHAGHLRSYQDARAAGDGFTRRVGGKRKQREVPTVAGPALINRELALLARIMTLAAGVDSGLGANYLPLQEDEKDIHKALSPDEQDCFPDDMAANPEVAGDLLGCAGGAVQTSCSQADEMRTLRQGDINLTHRIVAVNRRHGKNSYSPARSDDQRCRMHAGAGAAAGAVCGAWR